MTLNHSKTWPVNTFSVVHLRLNSAGHIYSALSDGDTAEKKTKNTEIMDVGDYTAQKSPPSPPENGELAKSFDDVSLAKCNNNRLEDPIKNNVSCTQRTHAEISNDGDGNSTKENGSVLPLSRKHLEMLTKISPPPPQYRTTVRTDTVSTILDQEFDFDGGNEEEKYNFKQLDISQVDKFHVLALARIEETPNEGEHRIGRRPSIRVDNWDYIYTERSICSNVNEGRVRCPIHRFGPERPDLRRDSSEPELPLDARKSATLRRHYYPEGSWGWVVVVCSVLVHLLNHGVQLSSSQLVTPGVEKFKIEGIHLAGKDHGKMLRLKIQARRLLCRHYYPEGGWGWVITTCTVIVHLINHGFQLSWPQLIAPAVFKFHVAPLQAAALQSFGNANSTHLKNIPKVYWVSQEDKRETIILENLKVRGFKLWDRTKAMDLDHIKLVLKNYGIFHGFSLAMKHLKPELFKRLTRDLDNVMVAFCEVNVVVNIFEGGMKHAMKLLEETGREDLVEKFLPIVNNIEHQLVKESKEEDKLIITHGDCWTNNMLFEYELGRDAKPRSVCFVDFQLSMLDSPVKDLSYFIYACCDKSSLDQFDLLLNTYYDSLSSTMINLGCRAETYITVQRLEEHWKKYAIYGLVFSTMVTKLALSSSEDAPDINEVGQGKDLEKVFDIKISNIEQYNQRILDMYTHFGDYCLKDTKKK